MSHYLVPLMLPLYDPDGRPFGRDALVRVRRELTDRFGGTTAYTRSPAEGTWEDSEGRVQHDDVIVVEVMTDTLDRPWWRSYAADLAARYRQEAMVIRAISFESLADEP